MNDQAQEEIEESIKFLIAEAKYEHEKECEELRRKNRIYRMIYLGSMMVLISIIYLVY